MSETSVSVADVAKDFLRVLDRIENRQETAILVRDGQPIAKLIPWSGAASTCEELAERWQNHSRLPQDEADAFARDLESARASLPLLTPAWD